MCLCYIIESEENVYDILLKSNYMDLSNYPRTSIYYDDSTMLVPGKFKDETAGLPIIEVVALRSKMYSLLIKMLDQNVENKKVAKGITRTYRRKYISHQDYVSCLENDEPIKKCKQTNIQSVDHKLYTTEYSKMGLSAWNDKRLIYKDEVSGKFYTLPLGHYLSTQGLPDQEIINYIKNILGESSNSG